jgi:ubiquinone biosynthesis protein UbiJ
MIDSCFYGADDAQDYINEVIEEMNDALSGYELISEYDEIDSVIDDVKSLLEKLISLNDAKLEEAIEWVENEPDPDAWED